jgi:hypothetical protein
MPKLGRHPSKKTREKMRKARQMRVAINKRKACACGEHEFAMIYNDGENCLNCGVSRREISG